LRKKFDETLYLQNDDSARKALSRSFKNHYNYILVDNEDIYGPDMLIYSSEGEFIGYAEVEIKQFWNGYPFKSNTLHIPERKKKFLKYNDIVFCVLNAEMTRGCWIEADKLSDCPLINKKNKYLERELFFNIPVDKLVFFDVT
jgi:hypothetical protein